MTLSTYEVIKRKRAELEELESQFKRDNTLAEGDFGQVLGKSYNNDVRDGDVVKVVLVDNSDRTYRVQTVIGYVRDWVEFDSIVKISPEHARIVLLEAVEKLFEGDVN